jgi:hypothetical protein
MSFDFFDINIVDRLSAKERVLTQKAETIAEKMRDIRDFTKKKLINAQNTQKRCANKKRTFASDYQFDDTI